MECMKEHYVKVLKKFDHKFAPHSGIGPVGVQGQKLGLQMNIHVKLLKLLEYSHKHH